MMVRFAFTHLEQQGEPGHKLEIPGLPNPEGLHRRLLHGERQLPATHHPRGGDGGTGCGFSEETDSAGASRRGSGRGLVGAGRQLGRPWVYKDSQFSQSTCIRSGSNTK